MRRATSRSSPTRSFAARTGTLPRNTAMRLRTRTTSRLRNDPELAFGDQLVVASRSVAFEIERHVLKAVELSRVRDFLAKVEGTCELVLGDLDARDRTALRARSLRDLVPAHAHLTKPER